MFARVARRYDLVNRLMTLGWDRRWRKETVRLARPPADGLALDVGAGTGDLSFLLAGRMPQGTVVGVDLTPEMLAIARKRAQREDPLHRVLFVQGDALSLPFADATFDVIVTGFVMRNVTDMRSAFAEMHRVTKPGGRVACLEVSRPDSRLIAGMHRFIFTHIVSTIGGLVAGDRSAYRYLPSSAAAFPSREELAEIMHQAGWQVQEIRPLMLGAAAIHLGIKP